MIYIKKLILTFVLLGSLGTQGFSQWDSTWVKTYGGNRDDTAHDIIKTKDNGVLIIGSTGSFGFDNSQMYFLKLDSIGNIVWSKSHGGNGQESGHSVIETSDGGYLGVGYTSSWGNGGFDLLIVKLDSNGVLEYEDYFGGSDWDFAYDVIEFSTNIFIIVGETQSFGAGGSDAWVVKYNANNNSFEWNKTIGSTTDEKFNSVTKDSFNQFYAAGSGVKNGKTDEDVLISKFNLLGDTIWTKFYGDTLSDYVNDIIRFSDSNFVCTGSTFSSVDSSDVYNLKIDSAGNIIWEETWNIRVKDEGTKATELDSQKLAIVGTDLTIYKETDLFVVQTKAFSSSFDKSFIFGPFDDENGTGILPFLTKNKLLISGFSSSLTNFNSILLILLDSNLQVDNPNSHIQITDSTNVLSNDNKSIAPDNISISYNYDGYLLISQNTVQYPIQIQLFSPEGKLILNSTKKIEHHINIKSINSGIYILRILDDQNHYMWHEKIYLPR
jgi:hypothetical protein